MSVKSGQHTVDREEVEAKMECRKNTEVASKRIPVTEKIWESLSTLKKPGQTYDHLLEEMISLKQERDFLNHIDEIEKHGTFVSLSDAAKELNFKEVA